LWFAVRVRSSVDTMDERPAIPSQRAPAVVLASED
jgi:hypothetical protein